MCRSWFARSCTSSCMDTAGTEIIELTGKGIAKGERHEHGRASLWPLGPRPGQLSRLHLVRLQLLQATDDAGLALVRCVQRLSGGAVCGDVRLSTLHLFPVGLAPKPLPRDRLVLPRCRPPARDDVRLADEPTFRAVSYSEFCADRRRLRADRHGVARAVRSPASSYPRDG